MSARPMIALIIGIFILLVASLSLYTVTEGHRVLILRLGKLMRDPQTSKVDIMMPGIHIKTPFITRLRRFDIRLQNLDVESSRILTAEQKYVLVDYFAKWRINNLPLYFKRTGGYAYRAQVLLKQKINDALRAAFGKRDIKDVVSGERLDIMSLLKEKANESAKGLGITVLDVRIKGIDLPQEVRESVFQRMRTEREQVATKHRSQGEAAAEAIRANADALLAVSVAKGKTDAQRIRAKGDTKAADIYIHAYASNPSFYAFYRSLQAYGRVFRNKGTIMVIKPNGQFFKYFNKSHPATP